MLPRTPITFRVPISSANISFAACLRSFFAGAFLVVFAVLDEAAADFFGAVAFVFERVDLAADLAVSAVFFSVFAVFSSVCSVTCCSSTI